MDSPFHLLNMLRVEKLQEHTKSTIPPSEIGPSKERSNVSPLQETNTCTMQTTSVFCLVSQVKRKGKRSSTQECPHPNKKKVLNDRSVVCRKNIQTQPSSKTLEADSISSGKDFKPFWNELCQNVSKKLWLPIATECADLDSTSLKPSVTNSTSSSWFSIKTVSARKPSSKTILSPFVHSSLLKPMDAEVAKKEMEVEEKRKEKPLKSRSIKLQLTKRQKKILKQWMGSSRWTYNQCVSKSKSEKVTLESLREYCVYEDSALFPKNEWLKNTPQSIRDLSVRQFITSYKTELKKYKKSGKPFDMSHKSRKDGDMIEINRRDIEGKKKLFPQICPLFGHFKGHKEWPEIHGAIKLTRDKFDTFYIHIPTLYEYQKTIEEAKKTIALDPGNRKFLVGYDTETIVTVGNHEFSSIKKYLRAIDAVCSKRDKAKKKKKKKMYSKVINRLYKRVKNLRDDCHKKTAHYLTTNYDLIILPKFETQKMVKKEKRNINSRSARTMMTWAHYSFRERLAFKCKERGKHLKIVDESYTSMTCTRCGHLKTTKSSAEWYKCKQCHLEIDRDYLGARNIYLKHMTRILPPRAWMDVSSSCIQPSSGLVDFQRILAIH